jgi:FkbM family methyltransferase
VSISRSALWRLARAYRIFRSPLWVRVQRWLGFDVVKVVDERTRLRFRCRKGADRMFHETFLLRPYDIPLVPLRAGDLVVDIGANHGFAAIDFARCGAEVLAFEPSPTVFAFLRANVAANGFEGKVWTENAAVTDFDGETEFLETPEMGGGMSTLEGGYLTATGAPVGVRTRVATRSILSVLAGLGGRRVRLLKVDCEGSELRILKLLDREARGSIDAMALEYHCSIYEMRELAEVLRDWTEFDLSQPRTEDQPNQILHLVRREVATGAIAGAFG